MRLAHTLLAGAVCLLITGLAVQSPAQRARAARSKDRDYKRHMQERRRVSE